MGVSDPATLLLYLFLRETEDQENKAVIHSLAQRRVCLLLCWVFLTTFPQYYVWNKSEIFHIKRKKTNKNIGFQYIAHRSSSESQFCTVFFSFIWVRTQSTQLILQRVAGTLSNAKEEKTNILLCLIDGWPLANRRSPVLARQHAERTPIPDKPDPFHQPPAGK